MLVELFSSEKRKNPGKLEVFPINDEKFFYQGLKLFCDSLPMHFIPVEGVPEYSYSGFLQSI